MAPLQTLASGAATITIPANSFTSTGSVTLTASYSGDTNYNSASAHHRHRKQAGNNRRRLHRHGHRHRCCGPYHPYPNLYLDRELVDLSGKVGYRYPILAQPGWGFPLRPKIRVGMEPIVTVRSLSVCAARFNASASTASCWRARFASFASMASLTPGMTTAA